MSTLVGGRRWFTLSLISAMVVLIGVGGLAAHTSPIASGPGPAITAAAISDADAAEADSRSFMGQQAFEHSYPLGSIPNDAFLRGIQHAHLMSRPHQVASSWTELGPAQAQAADVPNPTNKDRGRVSGRVLSIAVDPSTCGGDTCQTIFAGTYGGVWRSDDAGQSWIPLTDNQNSLTIGVITLDPSNPNIIYAGTGDPAGDRGGEGILRSLDGGQTWDVLGEDQFYNRAITGIVVDPRTAGDTNAYLYVTTTRATAGGATTGGGSRPNYEPKLGFYYSQDGGASWTLSNPTDYKYSDTSGGIRARSLVMDPQDSDVLYAGFEHDGVYKSTDDGQNWTRLGNGLPDDNFNRVVVDLSAQYSQWLYAAYEMTDKNGSHLGLFQSKDSGASWTLMTRTPDSCGTQCFANLTLAVDPTNPNVVYVGGSANYGYLHHSDKSCEVLSPLAASCNSSLMKTGDGGATWADVSENGSADPLHPDAHAILVDPSNPDVVYAGNDGGLFHTADGGKTWDDLNTDLRTMMVQGISVGSSGNIYIGTQDNGSFELPAGGTDWTHIADGDGGFTLADPADANISYDSRYGANLYRNDHSGSAYKETFISSFWADYQNKNRGMFYEPYAAAPSAPQDLFYGTYRVWRSTKRGGTDGNNDGNAFNDKKDKTDWVPISFDLSCAQQPANPSDQCRGKATYDGISALAVSPTDPNVMAVAASNGQIWYTQNALAPVKTDSTCDPRKNKDDAAECNFVSGVTWTRIDQGLPQRFPTSITFYPGTTDSLYVTYSGFNEDTPDSPGHVFFSNDAGKDWYDVDGSGDQSTTLPNLPFNDIVVNPDNGHLYASADYGTYVSNDYGAHWYYFDTYLPASPVYQMQYDEPSGLLLVATFGRGVWATAAP